MPEVDQLKQDLLAWAASCGILSENALRGAGAIIGDPGNVPFSVAHAGYFKTRKIEKISATRTGRNYVFSIFSRLPIAKSKADTLKREFLKKFANDGYSLEIGVSRSFKIDQNVQDTLNPVYFHRRRFACGSSIGLGNQRNAGTLTGLARGPENRLLGISCNHVTGGCNAARPLGGSPPLFYRESN